MLVGPEEPLVRGVVDFLNKHKIKVFGPNKYAAKLEGSKAFMKSICKKNKIPTAKFKICKNKKDVKSYHWSDNDAGFVNPASKAPHATPLLVEAAVVE